jgi:hypothetical protein
MILVSVILITCEFILPTLIYSQTIWYGRETKNNVSVEINKPVTPSESILRFVIPGFDALSGSVFLSGRYSLKKNKNITFIADFPIAHGNIDDTIITNGSETIIGNPYIGTEFDIPSTPIYFQLGLRIPLVPDDNAVAKIAGIYSDFDRSEAFMHDIFPIYGAVNFNTVSENKILFAARGGVNVLFNSDTINFESDPSLIVDYNFQTGYIDKQIEVILSAVGRYDVSSGTLYPEKRSLIQYGLSVIVPVNNIRPAISLRVPGNDRSGDVINYVIGLDFMYLFMP